MTNYDYWANHTFLASSQISEKAAVDYLLKGGSNPYSHDIPDLSARVALSALALLGDKEYARAGTRREPGGLSQLYQQQVLRDYLHERLEQYRDLLEPAPDLSPLPIGSFTISFTFTLTKPYLSKDDTALHLLDNPVKKAWVFKLPYVAATQWKGSLRHALWQLGYQQEDEQIERLFGTANDDQPEVGNSGRLYFYPSFFTQISLEVINPHDRETGAGSLPIYFETVPSGTPAAFTLLYTPLNRIGKDAAETRQQIFADLYLVAEGLQALFTVYGFGAKTSSGFGLADGEVRDGAIVVGGLAHESESPVPETTPPTPSQPSLPRYLSASDTLHSDFVSETGAIKSEAAYRKLIEGRGQKYAKQDKQLYAKAKKWWEREGQQLAQQPQEPEVEPEPTPKAPPPYPLARETFETFADLLAKAHKLTESLRQVGGER